MQSQIVMMMIMIMVKDVMFAYCLIEQKSKSIGSKNIVSQISDQYHQLVVHGCETNYGVINTVHFTATDVTNDCVN